MIRYTIYPILGSGVVPVLITENNVTRMKYISPEQAEALEGEVYYVEPTPQ